LNFEHILFICLNIMFIYMCVSILNLTYLKIYTWKRYLEIIHIIVFYSRIWRISLLGHFAQGSVCCAYLSSPDIKCCSVNLKLRERVRRSMTGCIEGYIRGPRRPVRVIRAIEERKRSWHFLRASTELNRTLLDIR